jgi:hypothetical protein
MGSTEKKIGRKHRQQRDFIRFLTKIEGKIQIETAR